jgi:hypothetical protein
MIELDQYATAEEDGEDLWEISNLTIDDLRQLRRIIMDYPTSHLTTRFIRLIHSLSGTISSLDNSKAS